MVDVDHHNERRNLGRAGLWLALVVFVGAAYFYGGASWNQNARLDAIFTFVEPGPHQWTFRIDPFLPDPELGINTGDWTAAGGHYFANKAPGTMLLGALFYLPLYHAEDALGLDLNHPGLQHLNAYLINLGVSVVPLTAALVIWARFLATRIGPSRAVAVTLLTFFATPLFPYATQLWGHPTAAAFAMLGVVAAGAGRSARGAAPASSGLFAGLAVLSDFLALPVVAGLFFVWTRGGWRPVMRFVGGGLAPALLLFFYQWYCFGDPLRLPTEGTNPMFIEEARALGLFGWPSGVALVQLTVGPYRGLLFQAPIFIGALLGFVRWRRRDRSDALFWLATGCSLATLLWVSTFNGWHGGSTVSARYLIVVLPLMMLGIAEFAEDVRSRWLLALLALPSLVGMLAIAAVNPLVSEWHLNPFLGEIMRQFVDGTLHPRVIPIRLQGLGADQAWRAYSAWNWGDWLGLSGLVRLAPWVVLVGAGSTLALLSARRQERAG